MMPGTPDLLRFKELFTGIPSKPDLFKQARGGFGSGASLGQFGYGDKGSRQARCAQCSRAAVLPHGYG